MRRDGCTAEQIGGAGDDACDVRATGPAGRIWAIQCKHRLDGDCGSAVGVGVLAGQRHRPTGPRSGHRGRPHPWPLLLEGHPLGPGATNPPRRPSRTGRMGRRITAAVGPARSHPTTTPADGTVLTRGGSWPSDPDAQHGGPACRDHLLPHTPPHRGPKPIRPVADRVHRAGIRLADRGHRVGPRPACSRRRSGRPTASASVSGCGDCWCTRPYGSVVRRSGSR
ncbi:hypothetical protein ACFRAO_36360 [Streptomyces sp. NPDC056656]|uniref:hypothetical protein n=1 Tax=Streptomyces sp. NPDC056656 TaxID=3345895 RepID=UPI0036BD249B